MALCTISSQPQNYLQIVEQTCILKSNFEGLSVCNWPVKPLPMLILSSFDQVFHLSIVTAEKHRGVYGTSIFFHVINNSMEETEAPKSYFGHKNSILQLCVLVARTELYRIMSPEIIKTSFGNVFPDLTGQCFSSALALNIWPLHRALIWLWAQSLRLCSHGETGM